MKIESKEQWVKNLISEAERLLEEMIGTGPETFIKDFLDKKQEQKE